MSVANQIGGQFLETTASSPSLKSVHLLICAELVSGETEAPADAIDRVVSNTKRVLAGNLVKPVLLIVAGGTPGTSCRDLGQGRLRASGSRAQDASVEVQPRKQRIGAPWEIAALFHSCRPMDGERL